MIGYFLGHAEEILAVVVLVALCWIVVKGNDAI